MLSRVIPQSRQGLRLVTRLLSKPASPPNNFFHRLGNKYEECKEMIQDLKPLVQKSPLLSRFNQRFDKEFMLEFSEDAFMKRFKFINKKIIGAFTVIGLFEGARTSYEDSALKVMGDAMFEAMSGAVFGAVGECLFCLIRYPKLDIS